MKELKLHRSAQPLSVLLSALMLLPILGLYLLRAPQARAQGLSTNQPQWAVLDFANPSGYGSADVGRLAADSFVVELARINRYNVIPRQDVLNAIQSNNLTPPLALTSILRLGQALGVNAVVAGEVGSISFSRDHRQAKVTLIVRVIDPRSGFLLNGALAEGASNVRPIPVSDDEQLVNEAFANAAFNAVKQISKFDLSVATVLTSGDTTINDGQASVTLNKGTRDGLYPNLDMLVTRNGVVTGRIRVAQSTNTNADGIITDLGIGIRPGDRATAIYHLPAYSIDRTVGSFRTANSSDVSIDTPSTGTRRSAFSGLSGILVALLTAGLLYEAVTAGNHGSGNASLGGAGTNNPQAIAGRAQDLGGALTSIPIGSTISIPNFIPVSVRITANIGNVNASNFLEFHVYRSDQPAVLNDSGFFNGFGGLVSISTNTSIVSTGNNNGNNTTTTTSFGLTGYGSVPLFSQTGHGNLLVFDDLTNKTAVTASKPLVTDSTLLATVNLEAALDPILEVQGGLPGTGLQFGQKVSYTIEGLYVQPATYSTGVLNPGTNNNIGTNTTANNTNTTGQNTTGQNTTGQNTTGANTTGITGHGQTFQLTGLRSTNTVTYIEPVHPAANAVSGTGATNVNVTVPATRGADDYILRISATDASVTSNYQQFKAQPGAFASSASQTTPTQGAPVVFNNINLTTAFPGGVTYFYVVGARDSTNSGQHGFSNPYVFSDPLPLTTAGGTTPALRFHGRSGFGRLRS